MDTIILEAKPRQDVGKGASRRLRREDKVPAIVYGPHLTPIAIEVLHRHVVSFIRNKELSSQLMTLNIGSETHQAIVKNLERHVYKNKVTHIEFQAFSATDMISVDVSLNFINADRCVGVKKGGLLSIQMKIVKIRCLPSQMPSCIDVDLSALDTDQTIHLSDLILPAGVDSYDLLLGKNHNHAIAAVHMEKGSTESA